ncbi:MAG: glycosyl hydrolase family 8 [Myxococcota bacterium]
MANVTRGTVGVFIVCLSAALAACSSSGGENNASGGTFNGSGGASKGGSSAAQGGSGTSQGGSNAQGGNVTAQGGASSGGKSSSGGASAGGSSSGGNSSSSGGSNQGGSSNNSGGSNQGGSANGGSNQGGSSQGGGMSRGGANSAGGTTTTSGGASSGGMTSTSGGSAGSGSGGMFTQPTDPCAPRAGYRNLFAEYLSKSDADVDSKLAAGFQQLFHGTGDQPLYYESGSDEAYILDVNNNDVRSEGMSYGMMIAVHLDKKVEYNRLWKWARTHMYQSSGPTAGYFSWQANRNGQIIGSTSAPDGEEYFAMALILAAKRWGDGSGIFQYSKEAQALLDALATKGNFNRSNYLVTFGPNGGSAGYTDPSYVLPAFYQVWACFDAKNQAFWKSAVSAGRQLLQKTCNPNTGLAPYLANFDGSPHSNGPNFNSDSWRVVGNIMMDHHLFAADPWQKTFAAKYATFFKTQINLRPMPDEYTLSGNVLETHDDPAKALLAQHAMVGFAVPAADATPFLQILWDMKIPTGQYRYYDGLIYMLSMLHVGGRFKIY